MQIVQWIVCNKKEEEVLQKVFIFIYFIFFQQEKQQQQQKTRKKEKKEKKRRSTQQTKIKQIFQFLFILLSQVAHPFMCAFVLKAVLEIKI